MKSRNRERKQREPLTAKEAYRSIAFGAFIFGLCLFGFLDAVIGVLGLDGTTSVGGHILFMGLYGVGLALIGLNLRILQRRREEAEARDEETVKVMREFWEANR